MSSIVSTMAPIWSDLTPSSITLTAVASTEDLILPMPPAVSSTAWAPAASAASTRSFRGAISSESCIARPTAWVVAYRAADASWTRVLVLAAPSPTRSMICERSWLAPLVSEATRAWSPAPEAIWLMVWAACAEAWPDWVAAELSRFEARDNASAAALTWPIAPAREMRATS